MVFARAVVRGDKVEGGGAECEDEAKDHETVVPPERCGGEPTRYEAQKYGEDGDDESDDIDDDDLVGLAVIEVAQVHGAGHGLPFSQCKRTAMRMV